MKTKKNLILIILLTIVINERSHGQDLWNSFRNSFGKHIWAVPYQGEYSEIKLGIGTRHPNRPLHIKGNNAMLRIDRLHSSGLGGGIALTSVPPSDGGVVNKSFLIQVHANGPDDGNLKIYDWHQNVSGGGSNVRMMIDNSGNLGIGERTPKGKLDVQINANHSFIIDEAEITGETASYARMLLNTDPNHTVEDVTAIIGGAVHISPRNAHPEAFKSDYLEDYLLWVEKGVVSEDYAVVGKSNWGDYVFDNDYDLQALEEVEEFIEVHHHLPGIPSAKDIKERGYNLHEMNKDFIVKIEELTLHAIQQKKEIQTLKRLLVKYQSLEEKLLMLEQKMSEFSEGSK